MTSRKNLNGFPHDGQNKAGILTDFIGWLKLSQ